MNILRVVGARSRLLHWQSIVLDLDRRTVQVGEAVVPVSPAEFGLMHLLISHRNTPMCKDAIMSALFGADHGRDPRQVDIFVARLRRSLAAFGLGGAISAVAGRGYAVLDDDAASRHDDRPRTKSAVLLAAA